MLHKGHNIKNHSQQINEVWFLLSSFSRVSMSVICVHKGTGVIEVLGCKLLTQEMEHTPKCFHVEYFFKM
jgi:hypothetical protein